VDINQEKVNSLNRGLAPIIEPRLQETLTAAMAKGEIRVGTDIVEALGESEICFVSVATPSQKNGHIDSRHLLQACQQIAAALNSSRKKQIVAIRSSVLDVYKRQEGLHRMPSTASSPPRTSERPGSSTPAFSLRL